MKKIIALILCLVLTVSLCAPAFAEEKTGPVYFALGDSIAAGTNLFYPFAGYDREGVPFQFVENTYTDFIRDAIKADASSFNGAHAGMRAAEAYGALTPGSDEFDCAFYDDFTSYFYNTGSYGGRNALKATYAARETFGSALQNADLITVNLGNNDLMGTLFFRMGEVFEVLEAYAEGGPYEAAVKNAAKEILNISNPEEAFASLLKFASTLDSIDMVNKLFAKIGEILNDAYSYFAECWDVLIQRILDENKGKAAILVVGMYNPIAAVASGWLGMDSSNMIVTLLNNVLDPIIESYNYWMQYGCYNHTKYVYVDMHFMESVLVNDEYTDGLHPGPVGHQKMAEAILAARSKVCEHRHKVTLFAKLPTIFNDGYTGDVFCVDCGALVKQGTVITQLGLPVSVPTGIGYSVVAMLLRQISTALSNLLASFSAS